MIMEPNKKDKLQDATEGFERGTSKACEMLEAYGSALHPEVFMGMLYTLFCAGYRLSRRDFKAMDHLVAKTLEAAKRDSREMMDEEAREMK